MSGQSRLPLGAKDHEYVLFWQPEDHNQGLHDGSRGTGSHRFGRRGLYVEEKHELAATRE
jgi:hypothetical protein